MTCFVLQPVPKFGFLLDIDGVFVRGRHPLPAAAQALHRLTDSNGCFRVPTVFVTNAGNALRRDKAKSLSDLFGVQVFVSCRLSLKRIKTLDTVKPDVKRTSTAGYPRTDDHGAQSVPDV